VRRQRNRWLDIELEQLEGVVSPNLLAVVFADRRVVEPVGSLPHGLIWVVGREQDTVGAELGQGGVEGLSVEVSAGGDVEVRPQVVAEGFSEPTQVSHVGDAVLNAPHSERQGFAEMAEDDPQPGKAVEQAAGHQPQRVGCGLDREAPNGAKQFGMPFIDALVRGQRIAGVQVYRHTEGFDAFPERQEPVVVVVPAGLRVTDVGETVEHDAREAELGDAPFQFGDGGLRVLHGHGGEAAVTAGWAAAISVRASLTWRARTTARWRSGSAWTPGAVSDSRAYSMPAASISSKSCTLLPVLSCTARISSYFALHDSLRDTGPTTTAVPLS
jgi:hypothetical protein